MSAPRPSRDDDRLLHPYDLGEILRDLTGPKQKIRSPALKQLMFRVNQTASLNWVCKARCPVPNTKESTCLA